MKSQAISYTTGVRRQVGPREMMRHGKWRGKGVYNMDSSIPSYPRGNRPARPARKVVTLDAPME
jgi:saccharopine dehydrogenase-like NADP-dependent oxidoreductase